MSRRRKCFLLRRNVFNIFMGFALCPLSPPYIVFEICRLIIVLVPNYSTYLIGAIRSFCFFYSNRNFMWWTVSYRIFILIYWVPFHSNSRNPGYVQVFQCTTIIWSGRLFCTVVLYVGAIVLKQRLHVHFTVICFCVNVQLF